MERVNKGVIGERKVADWIKEAVIEKKAEVIKEVEKEAIKKEAKQTVVKTISAEWTDSEKVFHKEVTESFNDDVVEKKKADWHCPKCKAKAEECTCNKEKVEAKKEAEDKPAEKPVEVKAPEKVTELKEDKKTPGLCDNCHKLVNNENYDMETGLCNECKKSKSTFPDMGGFNREEHEEKIKKLTKEAAEEIVSVLNKLTGEVTKMYSDPNTPVNTMAEYISAGVINTGINEKDKQKILGNVKEQKDKLGLLKYFFNALLKYEGHGVITTPKKKEKDEENFTKMAEGTLEDTIRKIYEDNKGSDNWDAFWNAIESNAIGAIDVEGAEDIYSEVKTSFSEDKGELEYISGKVINEDLEFYIFTRKI